jgi:hypothetical protein
MKEHANMRTISLCGATLSVISVAHLVSHFYDPGTPCSYLVQAPSSPCGSAPSILWPSSAQHAKFSETISCWRIKVKTLSTSLATIQEHWEAGSKSSSVKSNPARRMRYGSCDSCLFEQLLSLCYFFRFHNLITAVMRSSAAGLCFALFSQHPPAPELDIIRKQGTF